MNTYKRATTKRCISFPTTSVWDGTTWKQKQKEERKKVSLTWKNSTSMGPSTYSTEKTLLHWRRSKASWKEATSCWGLLWSNGTTLRGTIAQFLCIKVKYISIFFGVVIKSLLFLTKYTNGFIIIFRSCLTTCLLIILILMVTHCCFGCGSLQLQSVKSSGGMRHSLC